MPIRFPPVIISGGGAAAAVPQNITNFAGAATAPGWTIVRATADLVRDSATARALDSTVVIPMLAGKTYQVRGVYWFTAEAGGPSLVTRVAGPALTLMNLRRGLAAGSQTLAAQTIAEITLMAYEAADVSTVWNTGGPARALGRIELWGNVTPSAAGDWGLSWTGNSALWAFTRLKGSYLEYAEMA